MKDTTVDTEADAVGARVGDSPAWRTVTVPAEHGGWGLTLEAVLLGLLLRGSWSGAAIGVAAFVAFLARTSLRFVAVDVRRRQWAARSALAAKVAVVECVVIAAAATVATLRSGSAWLVPLVAVAPLAVAEAWYDIRSRSRRLVPELCGAVAMSAVASAIVVAGGGSTARAAAAGVLLSARSVAAIPFVRTQVRRWRRGDGSPRGSDVAQVVGLVGGAAVMALDRELAGGVAVLVSAALLQWWWVRRPPVAAKVLGLRQMAWGVSMVVVAGVVAAIVSWGG